MVVSSSDGKHNKVLGRIETGLPVARTNVFKFEVMLPRTVSLLLLLLLAVSTLAAGKCGAHTDCASCATAKEGLINCRWCASDNACHSAADIDCKALNIVDHAFDCPLEPTASQTYNETFAKFIMAPLAAANQGETDAQIQTCLNQVPGTLLFKSYEFPCDKDGDTCMGYLAVNERMGAIVMSFRGTKGSKQLIDEGLDYLFKRMRKFVSGGNVDDYFYNAFHAVWDGGMERDLQGLILKYPTFEGWFVGHSLGGAMASLASAYCASKKYFPTERIRLVTYGQPRTGDIAYAEGHDSVVKNHYRLVHRNDLVAHVPPRNFDDLFDSPFHHRYEIWYDNDMSLGSTWQMCTRADDHACSNTLPLTKLTLDDHYHYFGVNLGYWYQTGCVWPNSTVV